MVICTLLSCHFLESFGHISHPTSRSTRQAFRVDGLEVQRSIPVATLSFGICLFRYCEFLRRLIFERVLSDTPRFRFVLAEYRASTRPWRTQPGKLFACAVLKLTPVFSIPSLWCLPQSMSVVRRAFAKATLSYVNLRKPCVSNSLNFRPFSTSKHLTALDMETVNSTERLGKLRDLMKKHKFDVYSMDSVLFRNFVTL